MAILGLSIWNIQLLAPMFQLTTSLVSPAHIFLGCCHLNLSLYGETSHFCATLRDKLKQLHKLGVGVIWPRRDIWCLWLKSNQSMPQCVFVLFCFLTKENSSGLVVKHFEIHQENVDISGNIQLDPESLRVSPAAPGSHKIIEEPSAQKLPNNGLQILGFPLISFQHSCKKCNLALLASPSASACPQSCCHSCCQRGYQRSSSSKLLRKQHNWCFSNSQNSPSEPWHQLWKTPGSSVCLWSNFKIHYFILICSNVIIGLDFDEALEHESSVWPLLLFAGDSTSSPHLFFIAAELVISSISFVISLP